MPEINRLREIAEQARRDAAAAATAVVRAKFLTLAQTCDDLARDIEEWRKAGKREPRP